MGLQYCYCSCGVPFYPPVQDQDASVRCYIVDPSGSGLYNQ